MNVQAIICSFILSAGALLIIVGIGGTAMTQNQDVNAKVHSVCKYLGVALVIIGAGGYLFTLGEIIYRGHEKYKTGAKRKLEQQIHAQTKQSPA